jgi:hypothetical protein
MTNGSRFTTLEGALEYWGKLNDQRSVWSEIAGVISRLESLSGSAVDFHVPPSFSYVAVYFAQNPQNIGAHIHVGHIDHGKFLEGSIGNDDHGTHRTRLSTWTGRATSGVGKAEAKREVCPVCRYEMPLTGICGNCN